MSETYSRFLFETDFALVRFARLTLRERKVSAVQAGNTARIHHMTRAAAKFFQPVMAEWELCNYDE